MPIASSTSTCKACARVSLAEPTQKGRKSTQRERLLGAMIELAGRDGLAAATIAHVIARAGVSRPTFYEYFSDRDACWLAALADVQQQLLADVQSAVARDSPEHAVKAAIVALIGFANAHPAKARLAMNEALGGGTRALEMRDQGIVDIARVIEAVERQVRGAAMVPDVETTALIGGVCRMLATRLRRGEPSSSELREDMLRWVASYEQPGCRQGWRRFEPAPVEAPSPPSAALLAAAPPSTGRPRRSSEDVLYAHRQRILLATAEISREKGYTGATIAEISKRAGVDGRAFYRLFANKQDAFAAVHELFFQHLVALTASAFFTGESWPERIWKAVQAFAEVLERNPALAYFEFVESHAAGPLAMQRFNDATAAFTIFLQEGYRQHHDTPPPSLTLEAIVATSFEIFYLQIRQRIDVPLAGLAPHLARLSLVPFLGAAATNVLIETRLRARPHPPPARGLQCPSASRNRDTQSCSATAGATPAAM
jgi:AcrR family transcriptional regulator